jgi:hypothetical protein
MTEQKDLDAIKKEQNKQGKKNDNKINLLESAKSNESPKHYLSGILFLGILVATYFAIAYFYMLLHDIDIVSLFQQTYIASKFTWIGGSSNPFSLAVEIQAWSLIGIICQYAYATGMGILKGDFVFSQYFIKWVSSSLYGFGIAIAVILSLNFISLTIGGIEITLKNAPIETIIALAFILGFFSNEARAILVSVRNKLTVGLESGEKKDNL